MVAMAKYSSAALLCLLLPSYLDLAHAYGTADGMEQWGYVEVRPKAHMFWWLYKSPQRIDNGSTPWPTVLWLQGGPGASGVGLGNFEEIGPLTVDLTPRKTTWLQKADLLFVDNPVGTGYSYVEDGELLVTTDEAAATDLTTLLISLYNADDSRQRSPLYIVAESYGGKYAVTLALSVVKAVVDGKLHLKLGGVALGDSWISAEDFVFSWGPLLYEVSRLDSNGRNQAHRLAGLIRRQIAEGDYVNATVSWGELENQISTSSNGVDFYNFLLDSSMDPLGSTAAGADQSQTVLEMKRYSKYLSAKQSITERLNDIMNGAIKEKLKIIPHNITWTEESDDVFAALANDFMKPRINEVDVLLSLGVNVTIYNGQLDLICATRGVQAWVKKLRWKGLENFTKLDREPLYCNNVEGTKGFVRSYQNFKFYWILGAGHFSRSPFATSRGQEPDGSRCTDPDRNSWDTHFLVLGIPIV